MKVFYPLMALLLCLAPSARAQIYADVTVSHGETVLGTFRIQLHHTLAPRTVANFIGLATGQRNWIDPRTGRLQVGRPYYDGLSFHRLAHDLVLQGGDPLGTGGGGPGYIFQDEFHPSLVHNGYVLSMANSSANTNGSQFFITLSAATFLDNKHSVFGEVINDSSYPDSRALIDRFKNSADFPTTNESPDTPIRINSVVISGPDLAGFDINDPARRLPAVSGLPLQIFHDSASGNFSLGWHARRKHDYPVFYSTDLNNWTSAGKLLMHDHGFYSHPAWSSRGHPAPPGHIPASPPPYARTPELPPKRSVTKAPHSGSSPATIPTMWPSKNGTLSSKNTSSGAKACKAAKSPC